MKAELDQLSTQLTRVTAPVHTLIARVPDISVAPLHRQLAIGLAASIVLHLLIFLGLSVILFSLEKRDRALVGRTQPVPLPEPDQLNIQLVSRPKPESDPRTKVVDRRGMEASAEKPKNAQFESDENMKAGSETDPTGLLPLPSQEGRADRQAPDFNTQSATVGETAALPWPQLTVQPKAAPAEPAPPTPTPPVPAAEPLYTPNPVAKEALEAASKAAPTDKLPEPSKQVSTPPPRVANSTPKPRPTVVMPREDQIAVAVATPRPQVATAEPRDSVPGKYAMLSTPPPVSKQSFTKRYQEMLEKTRVEGSISNRGKAGVDAVATPFGRYWAQVKTAIGSGWNRYVNEQMTLIAPGTARVSFMLDREGHARNVRIDSNTSNSSFANVCERAVRDAPLPPIPPDVATKLRDGQLEYSITFTFYTF